MKQELQSEQKVEHWWKSVRTQALVTRVRAGELEGLRQLMILLGQKKTKYRLDDGTTFDTTVWIRSHLRAYHEVDQSKDGLLIIRQASALVGDQDLLLDVQGMLVEGTSQYCGAQRVVIQEDDAILKTVLGTWNQKQLQARDHDKFVKGKGEPNILTAGWLNMSTEERTEYMLKKHLKKDEAMKPTQKGESNE